MIPVVSTSEVRSLSQLFSPQLFGEMQMWLLRDLISYLFADLCLVVFQHLGKKAMEFVHWKWSLTMHCRHVLEQ